MTQYYNCPRRCDDHGHGHHSVMPVSLEDINNMRLMCLQDLEDTPEIGLNVTPFLEVTATHMQEEIAALRREIAELQASNALKDKALELACDSMPRQHTLPIYIEPQYWLDKAKEAQS